MNDQNVLSIYERVYQQIQSGEMSLDDFEDWVVERTNNAVLDYLNFQ